MEHELRCNNLECRALLSTTGQTDSNAIVTTCSHIFCVTCAETIFTDARLCPACEASLPDADDIVYTSLNPSQGFRTTILAGMSPMMIQDICGRALGFWTYQVTQEIRLQETVLKQAKEDKAQMEKQVSNIVREANSEIALMSDKIQALKDELEQSMRKNRELSETNRQSMKEYTKLKMQYEKVMSKSTIANSYNKAGVSGPGTTVPSTTYVQQQQSYLGGQQQQYGAPVAGHGRIAATPSRAFQPPLQPVNNRRPLNYNQNVSVDHSNLRPVNVVNNTNNAYGHNQDYTTRSNVSRSSAGSGRNGANATMQARAHGHGQQGIVQKHGSSYAVEGAPYPPHGDGAHQGGGGGNTARRVTGGGGGGVPLQNGPNAHGTSAKFRLAAPMGGNGRNGRSSSAMN